ncbi:beta strand repeat-containing protein [Hymenobacter elongatus]|uniref:T9SS type A sorting domain-containing protein n=1 Tax=Hymenobacter elongatus TaxID=877208 RepID=A0A4Z0PGF1_9BACT|nr:T9SS type A sorting domain-containing protein [Hymenobacter elongatus]TGE13854.1 T9SS type A sorting domain-containing protein [Hymenobacter elongatus]
MDTTLLSHHLACTGDHAASTAQRPRSAKLLFACILFLSLASVQLGFGQTTTTGNLQWWPLKVNSQDSAAVRAKGVIPATTTLRNFYLSDVTLGTAIKPYSSQFGEAFGSSPNGDGSFVPAPGNTLNRVFYAQFTVTAAATASLRADSLVLWSAFNNTASNLQLAVVYSKTGFTTNDSTEVAGGKGPIGPLTTRTTTPGTGTGTFADPIFLRNQSTGPNQTYRLALTPSGGVALAAGQTLTIRLYYASGSSSAGRYALLRDVRVVGQATTTSNCDATFAYTASSFCTNGTNPTPTISGTAGGSFSSTAGLSLNASTGTVNLAASAPGTYTVTYSTSSTCSSTATITVTAAPTATFSYANPSYCSGDGASPTPTLAAGATAGTFTSTAGLNLNASTGAINLVTSTPGTYTITNTVAASGSCAAVTATTSVTISPATTATFSYSASTFCQNSSNPTPTITGTAGGTFSSTSGLSLNASTGAINLVASTPGTYTVTYRVAGPCSSTGSQTLTITSAPLATFSYSTASYCMTSSGNVAPIFAAGASAGTFSATPAGLALNAATGAITPSGSTPGTYTVTNSVAASGTCAATSATTTVTIEATPTATLTTGGPTTFCQGGSVALTAPTTAGATYQFLLNGAAIPAATTATYAATASGSYSVVVTSQGGCTATSAAVAVTVNPATTATFAYSGASFCASGPNPTPTITGTAGGTFSSTAGLSLNASTGTINLATSTPGTYTVTYTVAGTCGSTGSAQVTITTAPLASFSYANAAYCTTAANPAPVVPATSTAGTFSATAGLSISATTGVISLANSTPGTYTVTNSVAAASGCSATSATTTVTVNARPATPTLGVQYNGPTTTLTSSAATGNQFLLNGVAIAGATGQTYVVNSAAQYGSYSVVTTSAAGCASLPSATLVVNSSLRPLAGSALTVYPNPTPNGRLTVELAGYTKAVQLSVFNALGQEVFTTTVPGGAPSATLDLTNQAAGVYILRAKTDGGLDVRRLIKE